MVFLISFGDLQLHTTYRSSPSTCDVSPPLVTCGSVSVSSARRAIKDSSFALCSPWCRQHCRTKPAKPAHRGQPTRKEAQSGHHSPEDDHSRQIW